MNGWTLGPKKLWAQKTLVRQLPWGNRGSGVPAQAEDQNQVQCTGASRSPHSFMPWSAPLGEDRKTSPCKTRFWTGSRKRQNYRERSRQWQGERRKYQNYIGSYLAWVGVIVWLQRGTRELSGEMGISHLYFDWGSDYVSVSIWQIIAVC